MWLRTVDCYYNTEDEGYRESMPVLHLFGRDTDWTRHHVPVEGYRPYFIVTQSEWAEMGETLAEDDRVLDVSTSDLRGRQEESIDGEPCLRVTVREPGDVKPLRNLLDDPHEADVLFPSRFLIDMGAFQWIQVPDRIRDREYDAQTYGYPDPIDVDEIELGPYEDHETPDQTPPLRVVTYDIEVQQGGDGPPVVSERGTEQARNPITAITAHDSYTDDYEVWVLAHSEWDTADAQAARNACDVPVHVYENPMDVVGQFAEWVTERRVDALMGWNASTFDHPYLVNWALTNGVSGVYDWSSTGQVYEMDGDGSFINSKLKGKLLLDLMVLYEKTQIHEIDSKRLADVADQEGVSVGKLSIEDELDVPRDEPAIDYAWRTAPETFVEYSLRDVQACVGINRESQRDVTIV